MKKEEVFKRIDWLLENGSECLTHLRQSPGNEFPWCPSEFYLPFKAATRSFFSDVAGTNSPYWHELDYALKTGQDYNIRTAINMLRQFKVEIEQGFLDKLESRITGEIFSDFFEMADFLVSETCYDAGDSADTDHLNPRLCDQLIPRQTDHRIPEQIDHHFSGAN